MTVADAFRVPYLSYEDIRRYAEAFLDQHHPDRSPPIPIEDIIEFKLGLDIVPLPGIEDAYGIVGFTSSDLREISVDDYVYTHQEGRYRFTLTHEVGHTVLHAEVFRAHRFRSTTEWKQFIQSVPELEYSWLEWQASSFSGLVLVPRAALERELKQAIKQVKAQGVAQATDFANDLLADLVARRFVVSADVIRTRLHYDQIDLASLW
ncbi:MAG: ImmA/IrrE family metallo-endopeptidase [Candidatus Omnitrophica bacterium]|nr:ImmA/IrrE family metallo-endopeptidase [Candidatus Omnitrophota bacterium]